jgi:hypothetical protein
MGRIGFQERLFRPFDPSPARASIKSLLSGKKLGLIAEVLPTHSFLPSK